MGRRDNINYFQHIIKEARNRFIQQKRKKENNDPEYYTIHKIFEQVH